MDPSHASIVVFERLRMRVESCDGVHSLGLLVASGFIDIPAELPLRVRDVEVILTHAERAAFLHAVLHHRLQVRTDELGEAERLHCLSGTLHASVPETEAFLTREDRGAHGSVSNTIRLTSRGDVQRMRRGRWFGSCVAVPGVPRDGGGADP